MCLSKGNRHQFRAKWHNYNGGVYFVTICAFQKRHYFGHINEGMFYPTALGQIIDTQIREIEGYYDDVEIWNFVVMPNHIHFVISVGTRFIASADSFNVPGGNKFSNSSRGCLKSSKYGEECEDFHHNSRLSSIVGAFKAGVTRIARTRRIASLPTMVWQPRFHEHIIRNQNSLDNIMNYINNNIANWSNDCLAK